MNVHAQVERIDHLGVIAGVMKDLKLVEFFDDRIPPDSRETISCGEAITAMIINGLGFSDRPLTLTPQFFSNKALSSLFRPGINAENFNRFKLGRALDDCHAYGCDILFAEASAQICKKESVATKFNSLDTTTFSLTGEYDPDSDEHTIEITHGYSKDHRPDLKQVVLELMCSHDGGIPIISRSWNGNASDTKIFRERAKLLIENFKESKTPRYLIADSKLYDKETIDQGLHLLPFITRIPSTVKLEGTIIEKALKKPWNEWIDLDEKHHFQTFDVEHNGLQQRWIVVHSLERQNRAEKNALAMCEREKEKIEKTLKKLATEDFACPEDAQRALKRHFCKLKFHKIIEPIITEEKRYQSKGRPNQGTPYQIAYRITGIVNELPAAKKNIIRQSSCFIVGTTIEREALNDAEVVMAYKNQNTAVERGFRFLKDPLMFTSSLFVKKNQRIMGLLMVMTLALLVYAVAQRRLHKALEKFQKTLPNQIRKETATPTLRWIFQLLEGIEIVQMKFGKNAHKVISGLTALKQTIIRYFGDTVIKIYLMDVQPALTS